MKNDTWHGIMNSTTFSVSLRLSPSPCFTYVVDLSIATMWKLNNLIAQLLTVHSSTVVALHLWVGRWQASSSRMIA